MTNPLLDFSRHESADSKFNAELGSRGGYINFSNSGKGGDRKTFTLSLDSFIMVLKDIERNLTQFQGHENYVEKEWRDLGGNYFSDVPASSTITVQTKPVFSTLSKIIIWANSPALDSINPEQRIDLSPQCIQNAIQKLTQLADNYTPDENLIPLQNSVDDKLIEENESIRDFAFNVFSYFYGENWAELIAQTTSKASSINSTDYISHDLDVFTKLIGEFKFSQTKETLTSSNTQRFFEEPIYRNKDKFYFFTNQWTGTTGDLSFESLKTYFETNFPEYKFEKTEKVYKLLKLDEASGTLFDYKSFHEKTKESGLKFSEKIVSRFVASLCTKPFVICSGLSGSGKTKLAQSFVKWICKSEEQYKIVPVGADWTNREPLLGFPNGLDPEKYVFPDSGALQLIINAGKPENKNKPYFLILDEMNLSHVERYFADFLSIMESQDNIKLYSGDKRGELEQEISWPKNLFIIGTVNIDETTYMFSPKVLDRANVIEFRISESEITTYLAEPGNPDMTKFINQISKQGYGTAMAKDFLDRTKESVVTTIPTQNTLLLFFNELRRCGAEFGYRSASEINRLIAVLDKLTKDNKKWDEKDISNDDFIDIAIMQKLLPKLHGSRSKLSKILPVLGALCLTTNEKIKENYFDKIDVINYFEDRNIKYKLSFEKICRMYKNAIENGYASYAEA